MIHLALLLTHLFISDSMLLIDFDNTSDLKNWMIVDDVVMGGRSQGNFELNEDGNGVFYGYVSLENYGGFSSVRYRPGQIHVEGHSNAHIRLKGDGKDYQFRVKTSRYDRHSYIYTFQTSGEWETITIPLAEMEPGFRGRKLSIPNYPAAVFEEVAFLIANKKNESFRLELDNIVLD